MIEDIDIYRTANLLIKKHGEGADLHAAEKADEMLASGDMEGSLTWKRILAAINAIRRPAEPNELIN